MSKPVCAIVGVGPGNGAALARRFSREGFAVALLARDKRALEGLAADIQGAQAYPCDATDAQALERAFTQIEADLGAVRVLIYNAGGGQWSDIEAVTPAAFEQAWRVNALGCMLAAQRVIPGMRGADNPNIVVIGATAALRGGASFTAFASAKAAQRSLAQSMARHLDPQGIHVAYVIIDGVVDLPRTRAHLPDKGDDFFLNPDHIAESVYHLTTQKRTAWTFELDLRPFGEKW